MPNRRRNQVTDLFDTAEAVRDPAARERGKRRYRAARRAVFASIILAPLNVLGLILMLSIVLNGVEPQSTGAAQIDATHTGRTQAGQSLEQWLSDDGSVFAGAEITSWDGTSNPLTVPATERDPGYELVTHDFTLRTREGTYYRAAVRTAYTPTKGVKVLSTPSVTPLPPSAVADWDPTEPTDGWGTATASASTTDAITSWAEALTTSPNALKLATRDEDPPPRVLHTHRTGGRLGDGRAGTLARGRPGATDTTTLVATVSIDFTTADPEDASSSTTMRYDVLVRGADTAAPFVTAWGPAGSGPHLTDAQNATSLTGDVDPQPATVPPSPSDGGGETPTVDGQE